MSWHHLNPKDKGLPDVELWADLECRVRCRKCRVESVGPEGELNTVERGVICPLCGGAARMVACANDYSIWVWCRVPGFPAVSRPLGPYGGTAEALAAVRQYVADLG